MGNMKRGKPAIFESERYGLNAVRKEKQEVIGSNKNTAVTNNKNLQEETLDLFVSACGTQGKKRTKNTSDEFSDPKGCLRVYTPREPETGTDLQ